MGKEMVVPQRRGHCDPSGPQHAPRKVVSCSIAASVSPVRGLQACWHALSGRRTLLEEEEQFLERAASAEKGQG